MSSAEKKNIISIIGAGKTGSALALELYSAGYIIGCVVDRKKRQAAKIAGLVKAESYLISVNAECVHSSKLIVISVKDDVLAEAVEEISYFSAVSSNTLLAHTSGVHTSSALIPSGFKKNNIASFHPMQSFMDISLYNRSLLSGIYFGLEGGTNALKYLKSICRKLNSDFIVINKKVKPLYHIACVIASNFLTANFGFISALAESMNVSEKKITASLIPLAETTLANIKRCGPLKSMTGPVARNDTGTILRHLSLIDSKHPGYLLQYAAVTSHLADMAEKGNKITKDEKKVILKILERFLK